MNQNDQMRELCPSCRNADIYSCTCPFKTARNSQPECFEPAKLVRLNDDALVNIYLECKAEWKATNKRKRERIAVVFGNAIMDAMEKLNGATQ